MQGRVESEGGSDRARSLPRCPPLPIWAGKERKLPVSRGLVCPWFGGGETRAAGPLPAPSGGLGKKAEVGRRPGDGASSGPSAGSMAARALLCVCDPRVRRVALLWEAVPTPGRGARSSRPRDPEKFPFRAASRAPSARLGGLGLPRVSLPPSPSCLVSGPGAEGFLP